VRDPDFPFSETHCRSGDIAAAPVDDIDIQPLFASMLERAMDGFVPGHFLFAAFLGGFASGLAGFVLLLCAGPALIAAQARPMMRTIRR
jgi:hypothetical protein